MLRRFVIKDIVTPNYQNGNNDTIVTVKEYSDYLFPDMDSWKETRDVLLIAIFERLHQLHRKIEIEEEEEFTNN